MKQTYVLCVSEWVWQGNMRLGEALQNHWNRGFAQVRGKAAQLQKP